MCVYALSPSGGSNYRSAWLETKNDIQHVRVDDVLQTSFRMQTDPRRIQKDELRKGQTGRLFKISKNIDRSDPSKAGARTHPKSCCCGRLPWRRCSNTHSTSKGPCEPPVNFNHRVSKKVSTSILRSAAELQPPNEGTKSKGIDVYKRRPPHQMPAECTGARKKCLNEPVQVR